MEAIACTKAIIQLAAERGLTETGWFRSYNSFQFGAYRDPARKAFGNLILLNDNTLAGAHSLQYQAEGCVHVLVLPTVGAVEVHLNSKLLQIVEAGSCFSFSAGDNDIVSYKNPYDAELINFIQFWLTVPVMVAPELDEVFGDEKMNALSLVNSRHQLYLGKFMGRKKGEYKTSRPGKGLYVMVLEGAFEIAERLLESRDALVLEGFEEIDFEALSNEAMMLMVEVDLH